MILSLILLLLFVGIAAYLRSSGIVIVISAVVGILLGQIITGTFGNAFTYVLYILVLIVGVVTCFQPVRRAISDKLYTIYKKVTPSISETEQAAIDSGTVWWDGELFSGKPDYQKLLNYPDPKLTPEEQAFIDGPVEDICKSIDDWDVNNNKKDLSAETWQKIKDSKIWGMIIKKKYGGLEFSQYAHAKVITKLATHSGTGSITVMVPNSLGPGELLQHYGTEEQKDYYLPRLAKGEEIPCFALTSPYAGSDAGAIPDFGVVCKGSYTDSRTGKEYKDVLGIRLSWEKRWITLAPVATVVGLAFKMYDPDGLLGDRFGGKRDIGITCALIPATHEGVHTGRRHYPPGSAFQNGPTWGADVFIPIDWIIGGLDYAGKGWTMLIECLSIGRCISLPASGLAAGKGATYTTSLYSCIRDQFGLTIGRFEGVGEAMARIGAYTYQMEASQDLALTALDLGENPSVISAMLKYSNTEKGRKSINDAMDVFGGRTVVLGPRNPLGFAYQSLPIAITVEGANILTRTLMVFGQGAIRCHPWVLKEMLAANDNNSAAFETALTGHLHFAFTNAVRSFWLSLTNGVFANSPRSGAVAKYYKQTTRLSANFAILVDLTMGSLGGALKFKEKISGRLADVVINLYVATSTLKRFERDGSPKEDIPVMQYAVEEALHNAEEAINGVIRNLPSRPVAFIARVLTLPIGRRIAYPSDVIGTKVSNLMMQNGPTLERLSKGIYSDQDPSSLSAIFPLAYKKVIEAQPIEKKLRKFAKEGKFEQFSPREKLQEALDKALITKEEFDLVTEARKLKRDVIMVDDFDKDLKHYDKKLLDRVIF